MNSETLFEDHVRYLSAHLRHKYGMTVEGPGDSSTGDVELKNENIEMRFYPGDERDPYISVHVAYVDANVLGPNNKYFELWRYVDYCEARDMFPIRWPSETPTSCSLNHLGLNRDYCFIGSPFLILEIVNFLIVHGDPILRVDCEKIQSLMEWIRKRDQEYSDRVSR